MDILHRRYQTYRCWHCISYPRGLDEVVPPPADERRKCRKAINSGPKSAHSPICQLGQLDRGRWEVAKKHMAITQSGEGITRNPTSTVEVKRPSLETYPDAVQKCVHATKPASAFYVRTASTGLAEQEIEDLVTTGFLRKYKRKPRGHLYRLSGKYHYLVPRE
jgi:hypothetical protein